MPLSSILCSWIQLTGRNKTWKFEENRPRKLNGTQPLKTMVPSPLFPSSRLISSSKTMVLSPGYHYPFGIGNLYHLLCAFSFYFLTKLIFFENTITGSTRSYWGNPYHLLCAFSFYFLTGSIFFENTVTGSIRSYWGNPYHLLCASPFYFPAGALGKPLSFTMCFPIVFPDGRIAIEETSII